MAADHAKSYDSIKFGDNFELDLRSYQLRRAGRVLRLERIPLEVLLLLLESKGQLVSREQIVQRVWGQGVFLDTDNSINGAIRKIRQVLKDDPEQPRFVQTITGRGYRFIAPVAESQEPRRTSLAVLPVASPSIPPKTVGAQKARWKWVSSLAIGLVLVSAGYLRWFGSHARSGKLTDRDRVVLADFVNRTGDPVFDETLKQALVVELAQSPFFNVVSELNISEALRRMGRTSTDPLTHEIARDVCLRVGAKAVIAGSISALGTHYLIALQALNCSNGEIIAASETEAANKEGILKAVQEAGVKVRGKIGESLASLQKFDFALDTTTQSMEALKAFSMGVKVLREAGEGEAIPLFRRAVVLDPEFALAYANLGRAYEDVGEDYEAMSDFTKAYELRDRLSEREKYYVTTVYEETVTGDMQKATETGELWTQIYPRDAVAREKLGTIYGELGEIERAQAQFQEALRLDPDSIINVSNSIASYAALNRLNEAAEVLRTAEAHGLEGSVLHEDLYDVAFLRGDRDEMERQVNWAAGKARTDYVLLSQHSDTQAYFGQLNKATESSRQAAESAARQGDKETAALCEIAVAVREAEFGRVSSGASIIHSAFALSRSRNVKILAALAAARAGDGNMARALIRELAAENPSNTLIKFYWLPTLKASLEIRVHHLQAAIDLLQPAAQFELSSVSNLSTLSTMYPAYVRGQAYLLEHNGTAAATEFRKLLDHPGVLQNSVLGVLSRLQLARAEALTGDLDDARKHYREFLDAWKDADPDVPVLKEAKKEYARLQVATAARDN